MGGGKNSPAGYTTSTTTQNTAPWGPQQAYLEDVFSSASKLYNDTANWPLYYPSSTYAPLNATQQYALGGLTSGANALLPNAYNALNQTQGLSNWANLFGGNPSYSPLANMSQTNVGLTNPGALTLQNIAAGGNPAYLNPALGTLQQFTQGVPGMDKATNQLSGLVGLATNPLNYYASGSATDPFLSALSQSVASSVVPSIQSQFIQGGGLSRPSAAYATSQGLTAGLAPTLSNAMLQEQQNQLNAAQMLGNLGINSGNALANMYLGQAGFEAGVGENIGSQLLQGLGLQSNAANALSNSALQGANLQTSQLGNINQMYNQAIGQGMGALSMTPEMISTALSPYQTMFGAGTAEQQASQQALNDLVSRWNYNQTLPYNTLNTFLSEIGGSYGGTGFGSSSSPFYQNQPANILSSLLGVGSLVGMFL